ncbi:hypothetical protein HYW59_03855 [Candidatus Kaiserbacteria bacterium]|nr:hypothetical protein [Candidatus Kaiserbacteria bacterium]
MNEPRRCAHCDPYVRDGRHIIEKIDMLLAPAAEAVSAFELYLRRFLRIKNSLFLKVLLRLGILQEIEAEDDNEALYNRSLVVVREARKRGIAIKAIMFGRRGTNVYSVERNGRKVFFVALPHLLVDDYFQEPLDDKSELKNLLSVCGFPHPAGALCTRYRQALKFVRTQVGFPVVVKPNAQSLSLHVTCNVRNEKQLEEAVRAARQISKNCIVEEHIEGEVFRISVLNGEVLASCRREPPSVVGDGRSSIRQLVEMKNAESQCGWQHQKNHTLHKISVSAGVLKALLSRGLGLDSTLAPGQKVYLHNKLILACGADIDDVTDLVHPANKELFSAVAALAKRPLVGIDFIAPDISRPHYEQKCGIIEINSAPYIDMHLYPTRGTPRNVADRLLDYCFANMPAYK